MVLYQLRTSTRTSFFRPTELWWKWKKKNYIIYLFHYYIIGDGLENQRRIILHQHLNILVLWAQLYLFASFHTHPMYKCVYPAMQHRFVMGLFFVSILKLSITVVLNENPPQFDPRSGRNYGGVGSPLSKWPRVWVFIISLTSTRQPGLLPLSMRMQNKNQNWRQTK